MQLVTCAHNPMKAQHVVPGLGKELPRIHVCGPGCLGGWTNWSQNAAADHRTQPGRPHERNSSDPRTFTRCPESWATYPTTCSLTAAPLVTSCDDVANNCFHEHAYGLSEGSYTASVQGHARTALHGRRSQPATAAWRWTPAASPGSQEATNKAMPDHNRLGPGNHKLSSNNEVTNMCTDTVHVPDAVRCTPWPTLMTASNCASMTWTRFRSKALRQLQCQT